VHTGARKGREDFVFACCKKRTRSITFKAKWPGLFATPAPCDWSRGVSQEKVALSASTVVRAGRMAGEKLDFAYPVQP